MTGTGWTGGTTGTGAGGGGGAGAGGGGGAGAGAGGGGGSTGSGAGAGSVVGGGGSVVGGSIGVVDGGSTGFGGGDLVGAGAGPPGDGVSPDGVVPGDWPEPGSDGEFDGVVSWSESCSALAAGAAPNVTPTSNTAVAGYLSQLLMLCTAFSQCCRPVRLIQLSEARRPA